MNVEPGSLEDVKIAALELKVAGLEAAVAANERNLDRLITEIDRLVTASSERPLAAFAPAVHDTLLDRDAGDAEEPRFRWRVPLIVLGVLIVLLLAGLYFVSRLGLIQGGGVGRADTSSPGALSPIDEARSYENQKNYAKAEAKYREILTRDPGNADAARHLASVLFRQDKWAETATVLKTMGRGQ